MLKKNEQLRETFARRIRVMRERRKMRLADVERRCGIPGCRIAEYEAGKRFPTCDRLAELAGALGTSADYLLGLSDYQSPQSHTDPLTELLSELDPGDRQLLMKVLKVTLKHISLRKSIK